ncbi:antibiotic biosynthesis monooxygenase [Streptomyces spongiicola]|uniref:Antibiotic biosynthesis monooxygenase n=2 Tax=Streptomyces TaxID=1883 RepID=A0A388T5E5_9ACTN|nr:antibiotic biosynthesis monooxygenase [Streptomyces spongiicola]
MPPGRVPGRTRARRPAGSGPRATRAAPILHLMSVVKINVLTVPAAQRESLEQRFAARAGAVESSDGFEWFELLRPLEGTDDYLVYTRWRSEEDFQNWMSGPMQAAHRGEGGGSGGSGEGERPKPAATGSTLWSFEVVQQASPKQG